jgi:hypothetical protein
MMERRSKRKIERNVPISSTSFQTFVVRVHLNIDPVTGGNRHLSPTLAYKSLALHQVPRTVFMIV